MKIGIDIRPLNIGRRSGVEGYITNLLQTLFNFDKHNQYKLFYNSFKNSDIGKIALGNYRNVKFYNYNYPNKLLNFSLKFLKYPRLDKMMKGVDIFFQPNILFNSFSGSCKNIITIHDLSFIIHPKYYSLKRRLWHNMVNAKKLAKKADGIIAVSASTRNDLVNIFGISPDKIQVIYSGISHDIIINENRKAEIIKKYSLPKKYFLYLGVLEPRKNIINIITAFEKFKQNTDSDHVLVLAGSKGWLSNRLIKSINLSKYKKDIRLLGFVSEDDKGYLYSLADIFIFPSFYEGFGFPPLEAMKYNVPVITSSVSSLPEVCGEAALYVDPYNSNELYQTMIGLVNNNNLKQRLITLGKKQIAKFTWEKSAQDTLNFFNKINKNF